ncbi:MAG: hypothetical protein HY741_22470 [Chloroflexi bacterium]|nr:hypothetical protein [Chloroflexota bacterium]
MANEFDKETALAYTVGEKDCVICNKVIFVEAARRFVRTALVNASDERLRLPDPFAQLSA